MRSPRLAALVVASALALGAGGGAQDQERDGLGLAAAEEETALVEWFAFQIRESVEFSVFCIALEGADPSVEFLEQLRSHPYRGEREARVVPDSACTQGEAARGGLRDLVTGEEAMLLFVSAIQQVETDVIEIRGGFYVKNLRAAAATYTLRRGGPNQRWRITGSRDRDLS